MSTSSLHASASAADTDLYAHIAYGPCVYMRIRSARRTSPVSASPLHASSPSTALVTGTLQLHSLCAPHCGFSTRTCTCGCVCGCGWVRVCACVSASSRRASASTAATGLRRVKQSRSGHVLVRYDQHARQDTVCVCVYVCTVCVCATVYEALGPGHHASVRTMAPAHLKLFDQFQTQASATIENSNSNPPLPAARAPWFSLQRPALLLDTTACVHLHRLPSLLLLCWLRWLLLPTCCWRSPCCCSCSC